MIASPIKMQFESVLRQQHIEDAASTFADPNFFDEIPLYSRYQQVDFLKKYGDVDLLLIELSLDYLRRVTSEIKCGKTKRLVAITIISDADDQYIVPYIFVCNGKVKAQLKELHLSPASEGLGKRIEALVRKAKLQSTFSSFEDRATVPDDVRVFVSFESPPEGIVNLKSFVNESIGKRTIRHRPQRRQHEEISLGAEQESALERGGAKRERAMAMRSAKQVNDSKPPS